MCAERAGAATLRRTHERKVFGRLVDVDVHPTIKGNLRELLPYMSKSWQQKLESVADTPSGNGPGGGSGRYIHPLGRTVKDAIPPEGGPAGSSVEFLTEDLLDRYGVDIALLIVVQALVSAIAATDPEHSAVMMSAYNDYIVEHWLGDERMRYAMSVSPLDANLAAAEIRRHGSNPRVSAVLIPLLNISLGSRHYYPIYEAAIEQGLPIVTHPGAGEAVYIGSAAFACGVPELYTERYCDWPQIAQACVTSLIMRGTFDRYPELKVLFIEWGFAWAVPLMWRMDKAWRQTRIEVPWVKKWPSEYVHDHIRFASQPVDEPRDERELDRLIEDHLSDTLLYSSDYPHWDSDRPGTVFHRLSEEVKRKVFHANAEAVLRI